MADDEPKLTPEVVDKKKKETGLKVLVGDFLFVLLQIGVVLVLYAVNVAVKTKKFVDKHPEYILTCIVLAGSVILNGILLYRDHDAYQNGQLIHELRGRIDQNVDVMHEHLSNLEYDVDYLRHMSQNAMAMNLSIVIVTGLTLFAVIFIGVILIKMNAGHQQRHKVCLAKLVFIQERMVSISSRISNIKREDDQ